MIVRNEWLTVIRRKRVSRDIYAQTREERGTKLAVLIVEMKAEIKVGKERRKQAASA